MSEKDKPNDQRSDSKNPNNPAEKAGRDNRSDQLNPNKPTKSLSEYLEQKLRLRLVFFQKCEEEGFGKG